MKAPSTLSLVLDEADNKQQALASAPGRYLLSATFAGAIISAVLVVSLRLGQIFLEAGIGGYVIPMAAFFGAALICILVCKVELFTSNVMYFTVGVLGKRSRIATLLKSWITVYSGNLLGVLLFTAVFAGAGALGKLPDGHVLYRIAELKTYAPAMTIFWKGVLCNWIICLAIWMPLRIASEAARFGLIMLLVFMFFFSGYEHSIANMAIFALAMLHDTQGFGWAQIMHNIVPATLGNIVGGGLGVGAVVYALERHTLVKQAA